MTFKKTETELNAFLSGTINENDILTQAERLKIMRLNANHGYGVDRAGFMKMVWQHLKARAEFDVKTLAKIEYRLTDINYHTMCDMLHKGDYAAAIREYDRY